MLKNLLLAFQLNEKEIALFLCALELGAQPASRIARACEMPRNTVRSILDNLVRKGLMVKSKRANTQYYATEKKESLIRTIKYRRMRLQEEMDTQIQMLEQYGNELSARHWATSRPRITFYEGDSGMEKVYEDTLTAKNGLKSWANWDSNQDALPGYFPRYYKRRAKKGIPMKSIHPDTPLAIKGTKNDRTELRQSILVPHTLYNWTPEIQMYNGKINIASWKDKLGIIIESREIAEALDAIFELSFKGAQSLAAARKKNADRDGKC
jgi:predicted transcriptional regulator